jgi:hypothetical protein
LKPSRSQYLVLRWSYVDSPEGQKWLWMSWKSGLVRPINYRMHNHKIDLFATHNKDCVVYAIMCVNSNARNALFHI